MKYNEIIFKNNPIPKWVYEISTLQILDVNVSAINLYGYTKNEFLEITILDLRPTVEVPNFMSIFETIKDNEGNIFFGSYTHLKKSGEIIHVELNGYKVEFNGKKCIMVNCKDVTCLENSNHNSSSQSPQIKLSHKSSSIKI